MEIPEKIIVKTGKYKDTTTVWASAISPNAFTIETNQTPPKEAVQQFSTIKSTILLQENAKERLKGVIKPWYSQKAFFRLNTHWSRETTYSKYEQYPLLQELHTILLKSVGHIILIDEVNSATKEYDNKLFAYIDVIFAFPCQYIDWFKTYCQESITKNWKIQPKKVPVNKRIKSALKNVLKGRA